MLGLKGVRLLGFLFSFISPIGMFSLPRMVIMTFFPVALLSPARIILAILMILSKIWVRVRLPRLAAVLSMSSILLIGFRPPTICPTPFSLLTSLIPARSWLVALTIM